MITEEFYLNVGKGNIYFKIESNSGLWIEKREEILKSLKEHGIIRKE